MRVIRAEVMGMCFGVRDALVTIRALDEPSEVTILGQLVHNEVVLAELRDRGYSMEEEASHGDAERSLPASARVLVTAHGISDRRRDALLSAGKSLIDTTCPLVERAHQAARKLEAEGYHVLVIGRKGHVEVRGIVDSLAGAEVVESEQDVREYAVSRLGVLSQTTVTEREASVIRSAIACRNPHAEIRYVDTICQPTKDHQRALEQLLSQVEVVVVVGGRNSNNTRALVALCRDRGRSVHHVRTADDLQPSWFRGVASVGLTAGTSTLDRTIEEVNDALLRIGRCDGSPA